MPDPTDILNAAATAAASMVQLQEKGQNTPLKAFETALQSQAMDICTSDLSSMEAMLSYQTQILHRVFTHALQKYAGVGDELPEKLKLFGDIALKAQSYCRLSMTAITQLIRTEEQTIKRDDERTLKLQNELLRKSHETVDRRGTQASGNFDAWMATMEVCHRSQNP